jgi:hypothetical protein
LRTDDGLSRYDIGPPASYKKQKNKRSLVFFIEQGSEGTNCLSKGWQLKLTTMGISKLSLFMISDRFNCKVCSLRHPYPERKTKRSFNYLRHKSMVFSLPIPNIFDRNHAW